MRNLVLILGDQLSFTNPALDGFDPLEDRVLLIEAPGEATAVWSHKARITLFLSAMRHFANQVVDRGWQLEYVQLDDKLAPDYSQRLDAVLARCQPKSLRVAEPGEWRMLQAIEASCKRAAVTLFTIDDTHFMCSRAEFATWATGKKELRMEFFYRVMRKKYLVLMEKGQPVGGEWNFDAENRGSFGKHGPVSLPSPTRFAPDQITQEVIRLVQQRFAHHPGSVDSFAWPVTRPQALLALSEFVAHRLPSFGLYQDAMWEGEVWLYHSHLSSALNLKLLNPREVCEAAAKAYHDGHAPLEAVEGFVRQVLGWREYVRGIYWSHMPNYLELNTSNAQAALPDFYWTGETDMACLRDAIEQTLKHGYAHHIQRLMVTGLYALLLGVQPKQVHAWYLGVYVDAVEWVELPNTLGMSQFADGGLMASKPYVASGKYIDRMSNHCKGCKFNPAESTGDKACPFTTLYWDYLNTHADTLAKNPRMLMQLKNLHRLTDEYKLLIAAQAQKHRSAVLCHPLPGAEHIDPLF